MVRVGTSTQVGAGTNVPGALLLQLTVPVGKLLMPAAVSVTVAVQVVEVPAVNEPGVQLAVVMVERLVTVTLVDPELTEWLVSPA